MRRATGPTSVATRSFISPAALLVNVIASNPNGETRCAAMRYAIRLVSTRVLPDPAPATTSSGPSGALAASRWTGLRPSRSASSRPGSTGAGPSTGGSSGGGIASGAAFRGSTIVTAIVRAPRPRVVQVFDDGSRGLAALHPRCATMTPVRFDPYDADTQRDPYPVYRSLRDDAPVYHDEERDFWALSRFDDVMWAAHEPARFCSGEGIALGGQARSPFPNLIVMDDPRHAQLRKLVSRGFTSRPIGAFEPRVRELARTMLDAAIERPGTG